MSKCIDCLELSERIEKLKDEMYMNIGKSFLKENPDINADLLDAEPLESISKEESKKVWKDFGAWKKDTGFHVERVKPFETHAYIISRLNEQLKEKDKQIENYKEFIEILNSKIDKLIMEVELHKPVFKHLPSIYAHINID